ncbi:MAG: hypothetical protein ABIJ50_01805 [Pseudomonadota bacterium]
MAKQKSSNARRTHFKECGVLKYAAMTRQCAATQQLTTFCNAIKISFDKQNQLTLLRIVIKAIIQQEGQAESKTLTCDTALFVIARKQALKNKSADTPCTSNGFI